MLPLYEAYLTTQLLNQRDEVKIKKVQVRFLGTYRVVFVFNSEGIRVEQAPDSLVGGVRASYGGR